MIEKKPLSTVIYHIGRLENVFINQRLAKINLRMTQAHLLKFVARHPGCIQKELGRDLTYQAGSLTNLLKMLEKRKMIIRKRDPHNGLQKQIFLLPAGQAALKVVDQAVTELDDLIGKVDPKIYRGLLGISAKLDQKLNEGMLK